MSLFPAQGGSQEPLHRWPFPATAAQHDVTAGVCRDQPASKRRKVDASHKSSGEAKYCSSHSCMLNSIEAGENPSLACCQLMLWAPAAA